MLQVLFQILLKKEQQTILTFNTERPFWLWLGFIVYQLLIFEETNFRKLCELKN
ncbi:hypothetical protein bcere0024_042520 [Bacillus cereus Rock4-18]|nr:hypothetical protein bcere0024_042520 [Bacillus cereus Rock4-18]